LALKAWNSYLATAGEDEESKAFRVSAETYKRQLQVEIALTKDDTTQQ
jgi:hypothetical protein